MPPKGKLKDEAIADLVTWVGMGAPWPSGPSDALASADSASEAHAKHWAFQPVDGPDSRRRSRTATGPATPIDRFVLAKLEAKGLDAVARGRQADADPPRDVRPDRPAADARGGRRLRGRRVARRLRAGRRPPARLAALRRALGPALARRGPLRRHQGLRLRRGRELPLGVHLPRLRHPRVQRRPAVRPVRRRSSSPPTGSPLGEDKRPLAALGFLTLGRRFMNNQHDIIDDRIDVVTRGLMGLTVTCARCHDHKFDPIPTADYYSLYGVFASSIEPTVPPLFQEPPRDRGIRPLREGDEGARAEPGGLRHREARRAGPLGPLRARPNTCWRRRRCAPSPTPGNSCCSPTPAT